MIILLFVIVPKRLDFYYQANIARKDLAILQGKKQQNNNRNIIVIIVLLFLFLLLQLLSPLFIPELLESEIPAKYLDHETLDPFDLIEPKLNTPRKQFTPRFIGYTIYKLEL
jgi:hypothetical protein